MKHSCICSLILVLIKLLYRPNTGAFAVVLTVVLTVVKVKVNILFQFKVWAELQLLFKENSCCVAFNTPGVPVTHSVKHVLFWDITQKRAKYTDIYKHAPRNVLLIDVSLFCVG